MTLLHGDQVVCGAKRRMVWATDAQDTVLGSATAGCVSRVVGDQPGQVTSVPRLLGVSWRAWGAVRARWVVCRLMLQAPAGRLGEPDAKSTGGVAGQDTPPPGLQTCRWSPTTANGRGWASSSHNLGQSALPDCAGTGGAALGWTCLPRRRGWRLEGPQGALSASLPWGLPDLRPRRRCNCPRKRGGLEGTPPE